MKLFVRLMQIYGPNWMVYWRKIYWRCPQCFETWQAELPMVCARCGGAL